MKMYKTERSSTQIVEIDVERVSEHFVWYENIYGQGRHALHSDHTSYWDTWDEARDHLISQSQDKKAYLLKQVERLNDEIETLIAMKENV